MKTVSDLQRPLFQTSKPNIPVYMHTIETRKRTYPNLKRTID